MAVYKPTYCYPYLESVDLTIPDGEKYFTCQIDTSNIKITGYRVELYNENNEKVFPLDEGKISPLSELNDVDGTLGLNGSELRFPFVQHWDSKIYPSYNVIYFKATNYVDYYQSESFDNTDMIISNGQLYYAKDGKPTSDPVVVDGSFIFVGDTLLINQKFYTITLDGLGNETGSLTQSSIVYVKGGDSNAGKILQYKNEALVESSDGAWCDVTGSPLAISNNGKTYKWQITLYSGDRGATRIVGVSGAVEINYSTMSDNEFNTVLTSGTILGSTEDRIQGPMSDKIYAKQWLQLLWNDEQKNTWSKKEWLLPEGSSQIEGLYVWTDGDNVYYSNGSNQYVLDKKTSVWSLQTWTLPESSSQLNGNYVWTDGNDIYYSNGSAQYVLFKGTSTWSKKEWSGLENFEGKNIWTDGDDIYYSNGATDGQYVLNKATSTWSRKIWLNYRGIGGPYVWIDGENVYYSNGTIHYILNKVTSGWETKSWEGLPVFYGDKIWTDGSNIYYSDNTNQYILDKNSSTWESKKWEELSNFFAQEIWTDGNNFYYSNGSSQFQLTFVYSQIGTRTYIESYSQSLGCIYPISGDSRGFDNSDLYETKRVKVGVTEREIGPATHFAVYKYSNDPNSITSQNSVDQSVNFVLTAQGMTYQAGSYSYEISGRDKIEAFNNYCKGLNTTPLCDYNYNEDNDTYEALHAGESVLIWNKENSQSNPLTGYFTINFSTSNGDDGKKIPKFVFDMVYAYRKVSSYIGKVFFVKSGSFANQNIISKAEATGENDVVSLGYPITFGEEEPLEIYPNGADKFHGKIFKNSVGTVYVSPFVGLQAGARFYVSDGTVIKAKTVNTTTWAVTYDAVAPASTSTYSSINPLKYEIRTNFKSSDETPFYAYDTPRLVPWSEQALSVVGTNGYEFLLEFLGQILTVPTVFSSEIHARYVHVTGQYLQAQNVSWTSYRWLLVDEYGQVIQDTGKQYDGLIETTFYGLNGPTVNDVEAGNAVPTTYYPVLIVEDELGNSLIMGMEIEVSLNPRNLPMEFSGGFDCKTQSVIMKITDYGYPKFSKDLDNKATILSASEGVSYQITEEGNGGAQIPINPIAVGDTIEQLYYNEAVEPDLSLLDWSNAETTSADTRVLLIGQANSPKIYATKEAAWGGVTGDIYTITRTDNNSLLWVSENARTLYGAPQGWVAKNCKGFNFIVNAVEQQDIWGAYISKDGQWKSGGSKVVSGEVKILGLDQQGQLSPLAANQVKIPPEGAQLKHFFAKDTLEVSDLSKAPKKLATNDKGNIEFHTKVNLDANFCGEILKYSVDIFDAFGNTDKLNISLELPSNFDPQKSHNNDGLNGERNKVKCTVSTKDSSKSASGVELFALPSQEAYYLQPIDWINGNGDITNSNKQGLEYLDFVHPFDVSNNELADYTNINESINIKEDENRESRDVGVCCLQPVNATTGNNLFNKWTDLKRVKITTPAGPRVVQTRSPAVWQDTVNDSPNIWTEGWNKEYDTFMVQVKRHAKVAEFTWEINGYLREIDALYGQSLKMTTPSNGIWEVYKETQYKDSALIEGEKPYVTIQMKREALT